jgi:hypothetical protein
MYDNAMFTWLKMHFIPHEGNNHRPHILHQRNIHRILAFVMFVEVFAFLVPTIAFVGNAAVGTVLPDVLSELTNQERKALSLPALAVSPLLNVAAQAKANDMAANSYFAHVSPDGKTPWYWIEQAGYHYRYAGENLAVNFTDSQDVTHAWMNSPTHRANIVKASYTQIGTGVAQGTYQGTPTIFVAQDFGDPAVVAPIAEAPATPSTASVKTVLPPSVATVPAHPVTSVLGAESTIVPPAPPAPSVQPVIHATFWQRLMASPRNTTNMLLFGILGIVALALFLNIGIKISHHHPDLILNGVMVIAVIGCVFVMNDYISKSNTVLIQSVDYGADHTVL